MKTRFCRKLKKIRMANKLSQREVAVKMGYLSSQQYQALELGKVKPTFKSIMKIKNALKIDPSDLIKASCLDLRDEMLEKSSQ